MTATANDRVCTNISATIPRYGNWRADITLGDDEPLPAGAGAITLVSSGITLRGTIAEQGTRAGRLGAEIVGGFGGWALAAPVRTTPTRPQAQRADSGVKLGAFAAALAADVGEVVELAAGLDRALGVTVPRLGAESAGAVLSLACASPAGSSVVPWWVRPADGVTVLGARVGAAVDAVESPALDSGATDRWRSFALLDASALLPGATVDGRTVEELVITATGDKGSQVVTLAEDDTIYAVFRRAVLAVLGPRVAATRIYRYQVIGIEADGRYRAIPRRATLAPTLTGLPLWSGFAGHYATPKVGSDVLVQFADGDPGFPVVVGFQPPDRAGTPTLAGILADEIRLAGTTPIALLGSLAGKLAFDGNPVAPALYYQAIPLGPYVAVAPTVGPPLPVFPGTDVTITTGSSIVRAG